MPPLSTSYRAAAIGVLIPPIFFLFFYFFFLLECWLSANPDESGFQSEEIEKTNLGLAILGHSFGGNPETKGSAFEHHHIDSD
jgi:hypothetical protein